MAATEQLRIRCWCRGAVVPNYRWRTYLLHLCPLLGNYSRSFVATASVADWNRCFDLVYWCLNDCFRLLTSTTSALSQDSWCIWPANLTGCSFPCSPPREVAGAVALLSCFVAGSDRKSTSFAIAGPGWGWGWGLASYLNDWNGPAPDSHYRQSFFCF